MLVSVKRERFFGGVCGFEKRPLTFRDPPHRHSGIDFRRYALAAHRSGFMQNRSYGLSRMHLPRCLVNKHSVNAPDSVEWHHGCCQPVGKKASWQGGGTSVLAEENMALARRFMEARV